MTTITIILAILLAPSLAFMSLHACGWVAWRLGCERRDLIGRNRDLTRQLHALTRAESRAAWCEGTAERMTRMFGKL